MSKRIALIGLDGSGKSANIDKMKLDSDYSDYKFVWVRWKPTLLKPAYLLMEKKVSNKNKNIDTSIQVDGKSGKKQAELNADYNAKSGLKGKIFGNPAIRGVWMFLALVDYFFQFHIKVLPLILTGKSIIFDRFFLDLFVDQGINFGYSPEKIREEIRKHRFLFPKMDSYVYIRVSPETCYQRKNDIPNMDYLNRRYDIYECLSEEIAWIAVDGELPFEEVNIQIKKLILG
ncbi:MAG: hypothetical protein E7269_07275 [Lachnospiraceae bacterium]|nr:hypothetical protein [Lachnospiraceae bacterium]